MDLFKIIYEDEIQRINWSKTGSISRFGPSLVENGEITVDTNSEVGQSMASNHGQRLESSMKITTLSSCQMDGLPESEGPSLPISRSDEVLWR